MAKEVRENEAELAGSMPQNRQMRRLLKRQQARERAAPTRPRERHRPPPTPRRERTTVREFGREVRGELRKVAWPTRSEVVNSTIVVLIAVTLLTAFIAGLDVAFGKFVLFLYD